MAFSKKYKINSIHMYSFTILPGTSEYEDQKHRIIQGIPDKYINGHAVTCLPKAMLLSKLQKGILDEMNKFYSWTNISGIFYKSQIRKIRLSLKSHLKKLKKLEKDLIKKGIYVKDKSGNWLLNEDKRKQQLL